MQYLYIACTEIHAVWTVYLNYPKYPLNFNVSKINKYELSMEWELEKISQKLCNMCAVLLPIVWLIYSSPNIKILSKPLSCYSNLTILVKNEWRFLPLRAIDSESAAESFPIRRNIDPDTSTMQMIPLVKTPFHRNNSIPINMPSEIGHIPLYYQQKENTVIYQDLMQYL